MRQTNKRKLLLGVLVFCITILFMLLIFEVAFRTVYKVSTPVLKYDEHYIYKLNPGTKFREYHADEGVLTVRELNDLGWYGPIEEYSAEKTKEKRVLVIGDSFLAQALPGGYDALYPELTEASLDNTDVVTIGVPSYAFDNEYKVLQREAPKYEPDTVVISVFVNDLMDTNRDLIFTIENGTLIDHTPIQFPALKKTIFVCMNYLRTCKLTIDSVSRIEGGLFLNRLAKKTGTADLDRDEELEYLQYALPRPLFYGDYEHASIQEAINKTDLILKEYKAYEERTGVPVVFFMIPLREQVSERKLAEFKQQHNITDEDFSIDRPYTLIRDLIESNNLTVVDPLQKFIAEDLNNSLYYEGDGHWTGSGHRLAHSVLAGYLTQQGFT